MIDFPENYFDAEERCGFKISHMMKCVWAAQLEVLLVIDEICKKHNLQYYAYFGTLLGAVRHKGFIPWDDDMDIAMKREDYIRFFIYAKEELPEEFRILSPYTEVEWGESFSRIVNSDNISVSEERLKKFHGCPFSVGIDIFPLDFLPKDPQVRKMQKSLLEIAKNSYYLILYFKKPIEEELEDPDLAKRILAENIKKISDFTGIQRGQGVSLDNWILQMFDAICMLGNGTDADTIGSFQIHIKNLLTDEIKKEELEKTVKTDFETITIDVPIGYDVVLKKVYRRYRELRFSPRHTYPFYKKQIPLMQGHNIWDENELNEELNRSYENYQLDHYGNDDVDPPEEWMNKIKQAKREGKRIVLFGTSIIDFLMKEEEYIDILKSAIKEIEKYKDKILIWWRPDKVTGYIYFYKHPELEKRYQEWLAYFRQNDLGILDETEELTRAINRTDAYWGEETIAYNRCVQMGKPCKLMEGHDLGFVLNEADI